ncbi:MAG TPA: VOC family protein [Tepidisphaeraceae bacterium]|jgi:predicted enzyme related to lactoylglutathione lyase|nr:VOC family protein [Tepidisphaeraceae bacterium]
MLRKVDRIILRVPHVEGAMRYYRDVLGLTLVREDAKVAILKFTDSATELVLHNDPDQPAEAVYHLVEDVKDLYQRREDLKLTFVGPPTQVARGFRASVKDPFGNVLHLIDRTKEKGGAPIHEDAKLATGTLFAGVQPRVAVNKDALIQLYERIGRTADDLPYTPHFESLYGPYVAALPEPKPDRAEVWRHLLNLRKAGKLPKLGEARSKPPEVTPEAREALRNVLAKDIGKRDRLPYTQRFDQIVDHFNKQQKQKLSPHLVWRLVATLAK